MIRNWKWWILGIILILVVPALTYEKETTDGIVEVRNESIAFYLYKRYKTTQEKVKQQNEMPQNGSGETKPAPVAQ